MAFEHKEGRGSLFPNERKQSENHPDWKGEFKLDGKLYEIVSWWKEGKKGGFHSLSVSEKKPFEPGQRQEQPRREYNPRDTEPTMDEVFAGGDAEEIPF